MKKTNESKEKAPVRVYRKENKELVQVQQLDLFSIDDLKDSERFSELERKHQSRKYEYWNSYNW